MSALERSAPFNSVAYPAGRSLWLLQGPAVIAAVWLLYVYSALAMPAGSDHIAVSRPKLIDATNLSSRPSADVRPMAFIVCSQAEVRMFRGEVPKWTSAQFAVRGTTDPEIIDGLVLMADKGAIDLYIYCE